jgi:hypothetical protein
MNVLTARQRKRRLKMIYTIDADNNISAFATAEEAAGTTTAVESFASQKELAGLAGTWPAERVTAVWNSLPGVKEVKGFKSAKAATSRIWERIQKLGEGSQLAQQPKGKGSNITTLSVREGKDALRGTRSTHRNLSK